MKQKWWIVLILLVLLIYTVRAVDTDMDGLDDDIESAGWTAEWYNCSNEWTRNSTNSSNSTPYTDYRCSEDAFGNITDGDCADDFGDRLWDLDARGIDSDGDGLIDWDYEDECRYCFPDPCPKHCNNYCAPEDADYWKTVACDECEDSISYNVAKESSNKIKFEGASDSLGEDGAKESDIFTFNVSGNAAPLNATLKSSIQSGTVALNSVGDSDTALGFKVTLVSVDSGEVTLAVESVSNSYGLSHVEFEFPSDVNYSQSTYTSCRLLSRMLEFKDMIDDYIWKIQRLSYVFNIEDMELSKLIFGLYSEWEYNDSDTDLPGTWVNPAYDDSSWPSGDAYLGYNESLITTVLDYTANGHTVDDKTVTYYFRKHFNITNISSLGRLEFNIDYDDGYIAYLNGYPLVNSTNSSSDHNTYVPYHESSIGDLPSQWDSYTLTAGDKSHLVEGENVIAVEVHQCAPNSTDIVLGAYLANYETVSAQDLLEDEADACSILSATATSEDRLLRQLLTLWFNVVSSNLCYMQFFCDDTFRTECQSDYQKVWTLGCQQYVEDTPGCADIDACTVEDLVSEGEEAVIDNATSDYATLTGDMALINNGSCLDCVQGEPPENLEITLVDSDNESIKLEWSPVKATYYNVYYSSDMEDIVNYHAGAALPGGMTKVTGITDTNWTDWNAKNVQKRYYRISSYLNSSLSEYLSADAKGKFTFYNYGKDGDRFNRDNWIGIVLDNDIRAGTDIIEKTVGTRPQRVLRLQRQNAKHYLFTSHEQDFSSPGFVMTPGQGYGIEIIGQGNVTIVGDIVSSPVTKTLYGGDPLAEISDYYMTDWISVNFIPGSNHTVKTLLENITNDAGLELLQLVKTHDGNYTIEHYYNDTGAGVGLVRGESYFIRVNETSEVVLT